MNKPTPEQLQMVRTWLATEPNAPKHFTKAGNEIARRHLDWCVRFTAKALGEPSEEAKKLALDEFKSGVSFTSFVRKSFKAMIQQLCKEVADE